MPSQLSDIMAIERGKEAAGPFAGLLERTKPEAFFECFCERRYVV